MTRMLAALPPLAAVLGGIILALFVIDGKWRIAIAAVGVAVLVLGGLFFLGKFLISSRPRVGALIMEMGIGLQWVGAAVASGVLVWAAIELAPESPTEGGAVDPRDKEVWSAFSAAVATFLGSVIIKPEQKWAPFKKVISRKFSNAFGDASTDLHKDARDAVGRDKFSAIAKEHTGIVIDGWGWTARRKRAKFIADGLRLRG